MVPRHGWAAGQRSLKAPERLQRPMRAAILCVAAMLASPGAMALIPSDPVERALALERNLEKAASGQTAVRLGIGLGDASNAGFVFDLRYYVSQCGGEPNLQIEDTSLSAPATPQHGAGPIVNLRAWGPQRGWTHGTATATQWLPAYPATEGATLGAIGMFAKGFILERVDVYCSGGWDLFQHIEVRGWGLAAVCGGTSYLEEVYPDLCSRDDVMDFLSPAI